MQKKRAFWFTQKAPCGEWDLNPHDVATTGTWSLRVCLFRHLRVFVSAALATHSRYNTLSFSNCQHLFWIFLKKYFLRIFLTFLKFSVDNIKNRCYNSSCSCGSVGTGRRARLRILWALRSCGFKSHLPHNWWNVESLILSEFSTFFLLWKTDDSGVTLCYTKVFNVFICV